MDLSVIIVNYNVRQFLENALASIQRAMQGMQGEIFVVDNASDDGSAEMVCQKYPDVCLILNEKNVGFAKANNQALERATGRYVLLINPDTVVQEDTFQIMVRFFEENPDVGLAGCKILNPDGTFQLPCRRSFPTPWVAFTKISGLSALFPRSRLFGKYNLTYLNPDETYQVDAVSGSFMMISRTAFECVGGLDETFFMYGEDLDWCYRVSQAGFSVYYVPRTKIIHFKGESTRRSNIDEIKLFYQAMALFVEKHYNRSSVVRALLTAAIVVRGAFAWFGRTSRPLLLAVVDVILVDLALLMSAFVYLSDFQRFPRTADPIVWIVPAVIVVSSLAFAGAYTRFRFSGLRAGISVIVGYVVISAMVFFAKGFAYSRAVVIISGLMSFVLIPGWRFMIRRLGKAGAQDGKRKSLFGRRTVIVGTGVSGQEVLRKLRARVDDGYDVLGFIDMNRSHIGERVAGVEIIGSIENVGKVISERKVGEVIFSTDGLSYTDILSVIARSSDRNVNFRLVPTSLEAIVGKTRIDQLDTIPLVDIEYNIHKPLNRAVKRAFDVVGALFLLVLFYPLVKVGEALNMNFSTGVLAKRTLLLPRVLAGSISLVGLPLEESEESLSLGPRGLTGLVQINAREDLGAEEVERYKLYYAKNQSIMLDIEIMVKTLLMFPKK